MYVCPKVPSLGTCTMQKHLPIPIAAAAAAASAPPLAVPTDWLPGGVQGGLFIHGGGVGGEGGARPRPLRLRRLLALSPSRRPLSWHAAWREREAASEGAKGKTMKIFSSARFKGRRVDVIGHAAGCFLHTRERERDGERIFPHISPGRSLRLLRTDDFVCGACTCRCSCHLPEKQARVMNLRLHMDRPHTRIFSACCETTSGHIVVLNK